MRIFGTYRGDAEDAEKRVFDPKIFRDLCELRVSAVN
jgi:hypothetical protein